MTSSVVLQAQAIHSELARLEELYVTAREQTLFPTFEQFAEETYSKAKEALEQEAVRLDGLLETGITDDSNESDVSFPFPWSTPHIKFVKIMEVLANLDTYEKQFQYPFNHDTMKHAIYNEDVVFVHFLLSQGIVPGYLFVEACHCGITEIVRLLLLDPRVDPSANDNEAIQHAISERNTEIVRLLLADPRVDPSTNENFPIRTSSHVGYTEMVRLLLADPRVDPSTNNNEPIRTASANGHAEVVRLLLADPRVDPSADDNEAIRTASAHGHTKVVRLLLADPRVDPSTTDNSPIRTSSHFGHTEIVRLLLQHPRVDPTARNNEAIQNASVNNHKEIVRMLLAWSSGNKQVDPAAGDNTPLIEACVHGNIEIVQLLLATKRVDPSARDNEAIKWARKCYPEIVQMLEN